MYRLLTSSSVNGWKRVAAVRGFATRRTAGSTAATTTTTRALSSSSLSSSATVTNNANTNNTNHATTSGAVRSFFSIPQQEEYKSLEYPNAKEPPEITKTVAAQVRGQTQDVVVMSGTTLTPTTGSAADLPALSADFVQSLRDRPLSPGVSAITQSVPAEIPPNVPAHELETPSTMVTQLDNGVRVVRYVYIRIGSRVGSVELS